MHGTLRIQHVFISRPHVLSWYHTLCTCENIAFMFVMVLCHRKFYPESSLKRPFHPDLSANTGIEIYDLAGHEEYLSSHSAIMASLCLESPAVFVLMVDLTKPRRQLSKEIYKWSNLIEIESSSILDSVIVVGSRKDELSSEPQLLGKQVRVRAAYCKGCPWKAALCWILGSRQPSAFFRKHQAISHYFDKEHQESYCSRSGEDELFLPSTSFFP